MISTPFQARGRTVASFPVARLGLCALVLATVMTGSASAAQFEWDTDLDNDSAQGGSGVWDTTNTNWYDVVNFTNVIWAVSATNDEAIFNYVPGTVDLAAGTVSANRLSFIVDGFVLTNGTVSLGGPVPSVSVDGGQTATINAGISGTAGMRVTGAGTLNLTGPMSYTGQTGLSNGVVNLIGTTFPTNASLGIIGLGNSVTLDLGGATQFVQQVTFSTNFNIRMTNGSLTVSGASQWNQNVGGGFGAPLLSVVDMSGLNSFVFDRSSSTFEINSGGPAAAITNETFLANTVGGSNFLRLTFLNVGNAGNKFNGNSGSGRHLLHLGPSNVLYTTSITVGGYQGGIGTIDFQPGITNGSVVIRGKDGARGSGISLAANNGGAAVTATINTTGGTIDFLGTNIVVGQEANGLTTANLIMNEGVIDALNILIANRSITSGSSQNGNVIQGGGVVKATNVTFGQQWSINSNSLVHAIYTLNGGTLRAALLQAGGVLTNGLGAGNSGAGSTRRLAFNSGTLTHYDAVSDLYLRGGTDVSNRVLNVVLGTTSNHVFLADTNRLIVVETNVTISGTGNLIKEGAGTLQILNGSSFSGETRIIAGTLIHGHTNALVNSPLNRTNADSGVWVVPAPLTGATIGGLFGTRDLQATNTSGALITLGLATATGTNFDFSGSIRSGQLTKFGTGTQTLSGTNNIGTLRVERGTMNITGVTNFINGGITVGTDNTAVNVAVLNWSSTAVVTGNGSRIGDGNQGTATQQMNVVSGSLLFTNNAANSQFSIGPKQIGVLNVTGGSITFAPDFDLFHVGGNSISFSDYRATGIVNVSGAGVLTYRGASGFVVGAGVSNLGGATGFVSLASGGTLETAAPLTNGWGYGTVWFDGGTLRALGNIASLISMNRGTFISTNGAVIDSGAFTVALNQPLADGTGGGTLVKQGAGTLRLNAANTFPGNTVVAGGTLGGTGSVAGGVIVASTGTIAPGASVGTFTVGGALTVSNSASYAWEHDGTNSDLIASGTAVFNGAWTLNVLGTPPAGPHTLISTVSGVSGFVAPTVTGAAGTVTVVGNDVVFTPTGGPSLTPFETWQTNYFGATNNPNAAYDADPDGDGANNLLEYAFGSIPTSGSSVFLPETGTSGNFLTITVPRNSNATDISYLVQGSTNLDAWATVSTLSATNPAPAGSTVTYTNATGFDVFPAQFLRVKITQP